MRLQELLTKVNSEKPNSFSDEYLMKIVNEVEAIVYDYLETPENERIYHIEEELHPPTDQAQEESEDEDVPGLDGELLIPEPYSVAYESYLRARLDYANEEFDLYANDTAQFNEDLDNYKAYAMRHGLVNTSSLPTQIKNWW